MASKVPSHAEYEWKRFSDVLNGDHVSVVRYVFLPIVPGLVTIKTKYCYWHHGIYSAKLGCVVAFSLKKKPDPEEAYAENARKVFLDLYSKKLATTHDSHICRQELISFEHFVDGKATGRVRVQRYGEDVGLQVGGDVVDADRASYPYREEVDRENAAAVAEFFVKDDDCDGGDDNDDDKDRNLAFGEYSFRKWNCECFATFCTTARCGPDEVQKLFEGSDHSTISEADIRARSRARSVQSDKFVRQSLFPDDGISEEDLAKLEEEEEGAGFHEYSHEDPSPVDLDSSGSLGCNWEAGV